MGGRGSSSRSGGGGSAVVQRISAPQVGEYVGRNYSSIVLKDADTGLYTVHWKQNQEAGYHTVMKYGIAVTYKSEASAKRAAKKMAN